MMDPGCGVARSVGFLDILAVQYLSGEGRAWWVLMQLQENKACAPVAAGIHAWAPVPKAGHCLLYVNSHTLNPSLCCAGFLHGGV